MCCRSVYAIMPIALSLCCGGAVDAKDDGPVGYPMYPGDAAFSSRSEEKIIEWYLDESRLRFSDTLSPISECHDEDMLVCLGGVLPIAIPKQAVKKTVDIDNIEYIVSLSEVDGREIVDGDTCSLQEFWVIVDDMGGFRIFYEMSAKYGIIRIFTSVRRGKGYYVPEEAYYRESGNLFPLQTLCANR